MNITSKYTYIFTTFDAYLQATMYINVLFPPSLVANWWPSEYSEKKTSNHALSSEHSLKKKTSPMQKLTWLQQK